MTRKVKEIVNYDVRASRPPDTEGNRHVAILLAHFNGEAHLPEQLQSLAAQTHDDWSLIISDDGSSDGWLQIADQFARNQPTRRVHMVNGPKRGFARNFLSLVALAGPTVPFAAFCDQDDFWLPEKLARAISALQTVPLDRPALYCGRTTICDARLAPLGASPYFSRPPAFRNALAQSLGGGNTMVLNRAALDLLQDTARAAEGIVSHDWWAYQIVSGAGGAIIYDPEPSLLYRQHPGNLIGTNTGLLAAMHRLRLLLGGRFRDWNDANTAALARAAHWLTPEARKTLGTFDVIRNGSLIKRIRAMRAAGLYRQTWRGQAALWLAVVLKKL